MWNVFGSGGDSNPQPFMINTKDLLLVIKYAIRLCHQHVSTHPTHLFLFPTFNHFVKEKMGGANGYTPYKNTILLFVSPQKTKNWKQALTETICHEFMHAAMDNHYKRQTLLDDLIFEGIAESFVASLFGVKPHIPSQVLTKEESISWYHKLKKHFRSTNLYYPVFQEGKDYPLWSGYAIGYHIIEAFREKHPNIAWNEIIHLTPKEIHIKAGYGK
jgi:uncharacterized protein YjaZ